MLDDVLRPGFVALDSELGVVILALSGQDLVVIKRTRFDLQVPLADHRRVVAGFLHFEREILPLGGDVAAQVRYAVDVRVLPGQHAGPAGRADRIGDEAIGKQRALFGERIDDRGGLSFASRLP